jgi:hypothetical protein
MGILAMGTIATMAEAIEHGGRFSLRDEFPLQEHQLQADYFLLDFVGSQILPPPHSLESADSMEPRLG